MVAQGDKSWFGWPTDPVIEKLRDDYAKETDPEKNKALAKAVQDRALETAQYGWIGQWYGPVCSRQRHRLAEGTCASDVEYREEVTVGRPTGGRTAILSAAKDLSGTGKVRRWAQGDQ